MNDIEHRKYLENKKPLMVKNVRETVNSLTLLILGSWHYTGLGLLPSDRRAPQKRRPPLPHGTASFHYFSYPNFYECL